MAPGPDPTAPPPNGVPFHGGKPALKLLPPNPDGEEAELGKAPILPFAHIEALKGFAAPPVI